jgi:hypothetical protein
MDKREREMELPEVEREDREIVATTKVKKCV